MGSRYISKLWTWEGHGDVYALEGAPGWKAVWQRTLMHVKYPWAVPCFWLLWNWVGPYNGVLAERTWAECQPPLRVTVLKPSFFLFYEELGGHTFQRTQTEDGKSQPTYMRWWQKWKYSLTLLSHKRSRIHLWPQQGPSYPDSGEQTRDTETSYGVLVRAKSSDDKGLDCERDTTDEAAANPNVLWKWHRFHVSRRLAFINT